MGYIYIKHIKEKAQCGESITELFADAAQGVVAGNTRLFYWEDCPKLPAVGSAEVREVINSSLGSRTPQWFGKTFKDADGNWKLEEIWAALKGIDHFIGRRSAIYSFRNAFGGYCSNSKADQSAAGNNDITNPWRDGGCVPQSPAITGVTAGGGSLAVSWSAPTDYGGAPVSGYIVKWKKQASADWNSQTVANTVSSHTIGGLSGGEVYAVQVVATNVLGHSYPVETTGTPK